MASHASTSATPGAHTSDNTPTSESHLANLIEKWGKPAIIGAAVLIALFWIGSAVKDYRAKAERDAIAAQQQAQAAATQQAQEAARQQRVCGSTNEPSCTCKGVDTVMRTLMPGESALIAIRGRQWYSPQIGQGYKLCNPDKRDQDGTYTDCVEDPQTTLHVDMKVVAVSTSGIPVGLICENRPT